MLDFAAAVTETEELVRTSPTGFDLTPLHPKLPSALSGLVEIAYDTSNQPTVRFIEPLVYESSVYSEDRQSVQLSPETGVECPFILSTPRLSSPDVLDLRIPFRHPGLEELFRSRVHGTTLNRLREMLRLDEDEATAVDRLPTERPDLSDDRYIGGTGRRDHDRVRRQRGLRLRHGRGKLARSCHGHLLQRGLLSAQAGRGIHDLVRRPWSQIGSFARPTRMVVVTSDER
jgi:hypothetical protein